MNVFNKEKDINKHLSFKDGFVNYDSADFRKDFDSFIKNINFMTQKNLNENKDVIPEVPSPTFNNGKDNEK